MVAEVLLRWLLLLGGIMPDGRLLRSVLLLLPVQLHVLVSVVPSMLNERGVLCRRVGLLRVTIEL
jgi:hypothetical protein